MIIKTKEEILANNGIVISNINDSFAVVIPNILKAMDEYAIQQEELMSDMLLKPQEELAPIIDLWRKENGCDKNILPDIKTFYKWITKKMLS